MSRYQFRSQPASVLTRGDWKSTDVWLRLAGFVSFLVLACANIDARPSTPVILISVDTLRADHLGCYDANRRITPKLDAFVRQGTLFSEISSVVPLTLPSHVVLFTSTYPFVNRVQDNGIPLGPALPTLATVLKNSGYRTAAFVGSFTLDRRFGLSRGFDIYDSPFDLHRKAVTDAGDLKRPGAEVAASAMRWITANSNAPFFLFLHLYDLHTPRTAAGGYDAELAYVDKVLGEFFSRLEAGGILKRSLIVFISDHGEGLGDHSESTHGYFVYQSTLHVPLVIHWPETTKHISRSRVDEPGSLLDVAPTILDALDITRPKEMQGRSLLKPNGAQPVYAESLYARKHFGCAALRTVRIERYKYINSPKPELYDLATDPGEVHNQYDQQPSMAATLRERLASIRTNRQTDQPDSAQNPDARAMAALRSLGYLSGSTRPSRVQSDIDPKDRIIDFEEFAHALTLASAGRVPASTALLQKLQEKLPDVPEISLSLSLNQQRANQYADAARTLGRVVEQDPTDAQAHFDLGLCLHHLDQPDNAIRELKAALAIEPWYTRAEELLTNLYLQRQDYGEARTHLDHLLSIDPVNYTAHYDLAVFAASQQNWTEAEHEVFAALGTDSGSAEAHNLLGSIYLRRRELTKAQTEFEQSIRLQENFASAHYNLGLVFEREQKKDKAAEELRRALKIDPQFTPARRELDGIEDGRP